MAGFTFTPLTPSAYLDRAAWVFRDRTAVVEGERSFTCAEFADRAHRLAGALLRLGVRPGGRVAALPKKSTGKIQKHVLREQARAQKSGATGPGSLG